MAYLKKKSLRSEPKAEKLPYKGIGATVEKLPYRGTSEAKATPLKKEAKKKSATANKKMMRTATPRNGGSTTKTITGANKFKNKQY